MELKEIGPVSCAKVLGILYGGIGLIAGVIVGFFAVAGAALGQRQRTTAIPFSAASSAWGRSCSCP